MPYINDEQRQKYSDFRGLVKVMREIETKGDLEYLVYLLMLKFMQSRERKYSTLHESVYSVVHSAHEFERNNLDVREDEAKKENGEIIL
jgi:hypothetical protein